MSGYFDVLVFSEQISHADVVKALPKDYKAFSAGFVKKQDDGSWGAYGRSESLDLGGQLIDSVVLTFFIRDDLSGLDLMNNLACKEIQQRKQEKVYIQLPSFPSYSQASKKLLEEVPMTPEEQAAHADSLEKLVQKTQVPQPG